MKKLMGSLGIGMIMGASVASLMMVPKMKSNKKRMMSPYLHNLTNQEDN